MKELANLNLASQARELIANVAPLPEVQALLVELRNSFITAVTGTRADELEFKDGQLAHGCSIDLPSPMMLVDDETLEIVRIELQADYDDSWEITFETTEGEMIEEDDERLDQLAILEILDRAWQTVQEKQQNLPPLDGYTL